MLHVCGLPAIEALFARDPDRVERLFFEPGLTAALAPQCRVLAAARKPYRAVPAQELARIAGTVRHAGAVAVARPKPLLPLDPAVFPLWARASRPVLLLDGIGNPHNLGAIVRSAAFFGIGHVVLADRPEQALPSDASYRVAEGALDQVDLYQARLASVLPALKSVFRVVAAVPEGGVGLPRFRPDRPVALVLGNEETGLDAATLAGCDTSVTIPGLVVPGGGAVQSLNVAAAAAILFYALTSATPSHPGYPGEAGGAPSR